MFREGIVRIATEYLVQRSLPFTDNELAAFVRQDLPKAAADALPPDYEDMIIKGSSGQGTWAEVPWLAFFDPLVTTTAMAGYYVVYLFDAEMRFLHLSLNQGTTAAYHEFGTRLGRDVLRDRADGMRSRLTGEAPGSQAMR